MAPPALRRLLAANLRAFAAERPIALNTLADLAGVSRAQLYAVLAKKTAPSTDWLAKVASALDVEPWQLLAPVERAQPRRRQ